MRVDLQLLRWFALRGAWFGPAVLTLLFLAILGAMLGLIALDARNNASLDLSSSARSARERVSLHLDSTRDYLLLLSEDMSRGVLDPKVFNERATHFVSDHPELVAITWTDEKGVVQWIAPAAPNKQLLGLSLPAEAERAWQQAQQPKVKQAYSRQFVGIQGGTVFDVHVPVRVNDHSRGTFSATFSCEGLLRHTLQREVLQKHQVQLLDSNGAVVASTPAGAPLDAGLSESVPVLGFDMQLTRYSTAYWSWGVGILTLMCTGLVVGMAWGMWALNGHIVERRRVEQELREARDGLEQRVRDRTVELIASNDKLQEESSERQRAEQRAREVQQQLAHVGRISTMGELAAGLAHELNQPLGTIASYCQGCVRLIESGTADRAELSRAMGEVASQARRASKIIQRLREFIVESTPHQTRADLNGLAREVADLMTTEIRQKQIQLRFEVDRPLPAALADQIQVQQVILNLMRNAIDSMDEANPPVRKLVVHIGLAEDPDMLEVSVSDTGGGADLDTLDHMFDAFFTTKEGGMGMGLSISRTIVEAHKGRIWATRNLDRGLTVSFTVPMANGKHHEQHA